MKFIKGSNVRCTLRIGETTNATSDDFILKMGAYKYMTNTVIHPFMKIGRAGSMAEGDFFRLIDAKKTKCPSGKSLTIRFDGEVFLCGGPAWTKDSMSFGNIRDSSLSDILNGDRAKKFSSALGQKGVFEKISRIAGDSGGVDLPDAPEKCSGACELCLALFSDAEKLAAALNSFDLSNGRPA
jgi:hypothetical protein